MALSIKRIIEVGAASAIHAYGRQYVMGEIQEPPDYKGYYVTLRDPNTGTSVPLVWSYKDEVKADNEIKRVRFARDIIVNGIECLDDMLAQGANVINPPDPGEDVINEV